MSVITSPLPSPKEEAPWNIYQSCKDLPLYLFIPCYVQGDLSGLVKSGECPDNVLQEAWLSIYSDYCERIGGVQIISLIEKTRAINALASKVERLPQVLDGAKKLLTLNLLSDELIESLQADGFKIDDTTDPSELEQQLNRADAKVKADKLRLDKMLSEMDKPEKSRKPKAEDFEQTLSEISIMAKHEVDDTITTARYCSYVKRLQTQIEAQIKTQQHGRRAGK